MHVPSVAAWNACGRFGATPYRRCNPSSSNRKIEHNIPSLWASIRRVILVRTSFRDAPMSIIFKASSTASLGRVCAGDGDIESSCLPTSAEAFDLVANANIRPNFLRHLAQEREGASVEAEFSSGIGDRNSIAIPNSDAMVVRLPTLFVLNVTEKDEEVEIAFFPEGQQNDEQVFKSIL